MHHQSSKIPTDSSHAESERAERPHILTINGGSSSLKFALFALTDGLERLLSGRIERIGMPGSRLFVAEANREQEDSAVDSATEQRRGSGLWRRLGGLATLVFGGGIGENSPETRHRICEGLEFPGISLDERRNTASAPLISTEQGQVAVRVIRTDEELLIARAAAGFIPRSRRTPAPAS
jgi:acetate kinase